MQLSVLARPPSPCIAQLAFVDAKGNPVGPSLQVNLNPGAAALLDLNANELGLKVGQRTDVRPIVSISPSSTGGPPINSACSASAEVFGNFTGRTHTHQEGDTSALPAVQLRSQTRSDSA